MNRRAKASAAKAVPEKEHRPASAGGPDRDNLCRCREASQMTPRELLAMMMNDLAFWKKTKKE